MLTNQKTNKGEKMIQSKVQMDGFEQTLNCLYDPSNQYWNGFANPYFDQTNFDKWVAWLKQEESDTYDEVKDIQPKIISGQKYYYCGGAYTWSYVEDEETSLLEDLENLVGDYQRDKITKSQVLETLANIVKYENMNGGE
ncbi:hypothetical protein [uncultured Mediterranean phage uvMED]|nr:hypothetical protein [uncultured Mediterranean phage uvMED]